MNSERLKKTFAELVSIDSPSFGERKMADCLRGKLEALGFSVREDNAGSLYGGNAGNLYAVRDGSLPGDSLLFSTHMDTVEPSSGKKAVFHGDGRITSEGTTVLGADCMSGTAAILEALQEISEEKLPCRSLEIVFFIGEEQHLRGSAVFDYSGLVSRESYVLDVTGQAGTAVIKAPSTVHFTVKVHGKAAHAGLAPREGVSAIAIAARAVARMEIGETKDGMTVNIGGIEGGGPESNIVPDECTLTGELRSLSESLALEKMEETEKLFREEAEKAGGRVEITHEVPVHAYEIPEDHSSVQRFGRACEKLGIPFKTVSTFGGSDESNLAYHGIPGPVIASAMHEVHSCQEYTTVGELEGLADTVKLMMTDPR